MAAAASSCISRPPCRPEQPAIHGCGSHHGHGPQRQPAAPEAASVVHGTAASGSVQLLSCPANVAAAAVVCHTDSCCWAGQPRSTRASRLASRRRVDANTAVAPMLTAAATDAPRPAGTLAHYRNWAAQLQARYQLFNPDAARPAKRV